MCGGAVGDFIEDVGGGIDDAVSSISDELAGVDDAVNENIPGGWATVALAAAGVYYAPEIGAYLSADGAVLGATEAEAAANMGIVNTATGADLAAAYDMGAVGSAGAGGATAGTAGAATAGAAGATAAGSAAGAAGGGITLGQVGSALAIASGVNALSGGAITNAITGGPDTRVNTGGGTGGGNDGGGSGGGGDGGGGGGNGGGTTDISTPAGSLQVADPFSPYRSRLAEMYSGYLTGGNRTDITQMPGYSQFESGVLNPALEATKRAGAKSGMLMSGNEQIALQKQGQTGYYGFMTDYLNRLATGSGASNNPYNAANLATGQANTTNQATMQGFGSLLTGVGGLLGNNAVSGTNLSNLFSGNSGATYTGSPGGFDNSNVDYNYLNNIYSGGNPFDGVLDAGETWMGE